MEELHDYLVRDDLGKLCETFASRLRNEAELGKVGSKRIDQCAGGLKDLAFDATSARLADRLT